MIQYKLEKAWGVRTFSARTLEPTFLEWGLHQPISLPYYELAIRQHDLATV